MDSLDTVGGLGFHSWSGTSSYCPLEETQVKNSNSQHLSQSVGLRIHSVKSKVMRINAPQKEELKLKTYCNVLQSSTHLFTELNRFWRIKQRDDTTNVFYWFYQFLDDSMFENIDPSNLRVNNAYRMWYMKFWRTSIYTQTRSWMAWACKCQWLS